MSPQHHFFVVFLELFFFSSLLLVPPPLFVKYQQVLERRRRRRRWRGDSRGSCVARPSRLSVHLTLSPHLLQFWLPLVCLSICICVSSPSFSSVPPLSVEGRLRNDQSGFDAAGPCPGFSTAHEPRQLRSAPSWLLLLCNAPVWSGRKKRRRRRGSKSEWSNRKSNKVINVTAAQRIHSQHFYILQISLPVALWLAARALFLDWEKKKEEKRSSGCCSTHVADRKYAGEALGGDGGRAGKMMAPLYPQQSLDKTLQRGSQKSPSYMIHTSSQRRGAFKKIFSTCGNSSQSPQLVSAWHAVCIMVCLCTSNYK